MRFSDSVLGCNRFLLGDFVSVLFSMVLTVDGLLSFVEETSDEAVVGGLHLGAVGEFLPEDVALFGVFAETDLLENGEGVGFEVFEVLVGGKFSSWLDCCGRAHRGVGQRLGRC